jgi:hypothetical protein
MDFDPIRKKEVDMCRQPFYRGGRIGMILIANDIVPIQQSFIGAH